MISKYKWTIGVGILILAVIGFGLYLKQPQKNKYVTTKYQANYVAIGDSIAAGVGLPKDSDPSACDRTNSSYPYLLARSFNFKLTSLACSGATITDGLLNSQNVNNLSVNPQLESLFTLPKPKLITLTIGANDVRWNEIVSQCYLGNCNQDLNNQVFQANLAVLNDNLNSVYNKIIEHYGAASPTLVVTGYFQALPSTSSDCLDVKNLNTSQLVWLRSLDEQLSDTLKQSVANYKFATFVPLDFSGHELCTPNPWIQGLTDSYPYHPTIEGQKAISSSITASLVKLNYKVEK
jgi:lysophospholipase L1-like esterase